jgi:hypothetical protein
VSSMAENQMAYALSRSQTPDSLLDHLIDDEFDRSRRAALRQLRTSMVEGRYSIDSTSIMENIRYDEELWNQVRSLTPFCTDTKLFLETLGEELNPSQRAELRELRDSTGRFEMSSGISEEKFRVIAVTKELWMHVEKQMIRILDEKRRIRNWREVDTKPLPKSFMGRVKAFLGWERKTKIVNKSDLDIKVIISHQPVTEIVGTNMQVSLTVPCTPLEAAAGRESKTHKGNRQPQQGVVLAHTREVFELPWKEYYLTIFTERTDGSRVYHEKDRLVRSSQNWEFLPAHLAKDMDPQPSPNERPQEEKKKKKWLGLW